MLVSLPGEGPLVMQVYRAIRARILAGTLRPGERLPATRILANELAVSRNTVLAAYDQLLGEGYASARRGSGTFVAAELPEPASGRRDRPPETPRPARLSSYGRRVAALPRLGAAFVRAPRFDFRYGRPAYDDFPAAIWTRILVRRARRTAVADLDYGSPKGERSLREAIAEHVARTRGIDCAAWQIVVTAGSQQALDLVARVLLDPGDRVLLEEPHYLGARRCFLAAGARIETGPVDDDGFDVARVRPAARTARLAYVTPSHHFPTGVVMSLARRLALLDWARRNRAFVVEDDYDSEYRYRGRPIEALAALDRDARVIYVGTFSKVVFPALRIGYLILPETLVEAVAQAKSVIDSGSSRLAQAALGDFLREGHFERHVRRTRARNAARRQALLAALAEHVGDRGAWVGADAGLHLLLWIRDLAASRVPELVERALAADVGVYSVAPFYRRPPRKAGLLLGYAGLSEDDVHEGIARLASAL
jgi:GntR family transcriptional regulator / MocR family aminotransferase